MAAPYSGLYAPWWQVAQLPFATSPVGPSRLAGNTPVNGTMYSLLISRAMRMPYQATARCGVALAPHSANACVLWQYVQFTPSEFDQWIICP